MWMGMKGRTWASRYQRSSTVFDEMLSKHKKIVGRQRSVELFVKRS